MNKAILIAGTILAVLVTTGTTGLAQPTQQREPLLYGLASFFVPGLGQALQGELQTGLIHLGVAAAIPIAGGYLAMVSPAPALVWAGVGAAHLGWSLYSAFHSHDLAVEYNRRHGFGVSLTMSFAAR